MRTIGVSVEDVGERSVFLLTGATFGGEGRTAAEREDWCACYEEGRDGTLLCVDHKPEWLQQESVMAKLRRRDAGSRVWERLGKCLRRTCGDGSLV